MEVVKIEQSITALRASAKCIPAAMSDDVISPKEVHDQLMVIADLLSCQVEKMRKN